MGEHHASPDVIPIPQVMVLYENDSVDAKFQGYVSVSLSPCGANVTLPSEILPMRLDSSTNNHQRTQFVRSAHRRHVQTALDFRNRFAEQIFLCQEIYGTENVMEYYTDITSVTWPSTPEAVTVLEGGALQLISIDDCATMTLAPNTQEFSVQFLCQISMNHNQNSSHSDVISGKGFSDITNKLDFDLEDSSYPPPSQGRPNVHPDSKPSTGACGRKIERSLRRLYVWQVQNFSVEHCPENWQYPLKILQSVSKVTDQGLKGLQATLEQSKENSENIGESMNHFENDRVEENSCVVAVGGFTLRKSNSSRLPCSLPLRCPRSDLHNRSEVMQGSTEGIDEEVTAMPDDEDDRVWLERRRLKAFFSRGVLFRVFWFPEPSLEVYPGDGSVLKSMPGDGGYFRFFSCRQGQLEEQVLSTKSPPPEGIRCGSHSLTSLLYRGQRLLMHMKFIDRNTSSFTEMVCWKSTEGRQSRMSRTPTHLVEECKVDGVGHFAAFSNGYIRILFKDRATLEFQIDIAAGTGHDQKIGQEGASKMARIFPEDIGRMLFSDGVEAVINLRNPEMFYAGYVEIAQQWAAWILLSEMEKQTTYTNTIFDVNKIREVNEELSRLQLFNYETHSQGVSSNGAARNIQENVPPGGDVSNIEIQHILGQTLAKIKDIDDVLNVT